MLYDVYFQFGWGCATALPKHCFVRATGLALVPSSLIELHLPSMRREDLQIQNIPGAVFELQQLIEQQRSSGGGGGLVMGTGGGKPCNFGMACAKRECGYAHPEGWTPVKKGDVSVSPPALESGSARFDTSMPDIHRIGDGEARNQCNHGMQCTKSNCNYEHPSGWNPKAAASSRHHGSSQQMPPPHQFSPPYSYPPTTDPLSEYGPLIHQQPSISSEYGPLVRKHPYVPPHPPRQFNSIASQDKGSNSRDYDPANDSNHTSGSRDGIPSEPRRRTSRFKPMSTPPLSEPVSTKAQAVSPMSGGMSSTLQEYRPNQQQSQSTFRDRDFSQVWGRHVYDAVRRHS